MQPTLKGKGQIPSYFPQYDSAVSCVFQFATVMPHSASLYVPGSLWHLCLSSLWVHQHWMDLRRAAGLWKPWDPSEAQLVICSDMLRSRGRTRSLSSQTLIKRSLYHHILSASWFQDLHIRSPFLAFNSSWTKTEFPPAPGKTQIKYRMHLHLFSFFPSNPTSPWVLSIQSGKDVSMSILPIPIDNTLNSGTFFFLLGFSIKSPASSLTLMHLSQWQPEICLIHRFARPCP